MKFITIFTLMLAFIYSSSFADVTYKKASQKKEAQMKIVDTIKNKKGKKKKKIKKKKTKLTITAPVFEEFQSKDINYKKNLSKKEKQTKRKSSFMVLDKKKDSSKFTINPIVLKTPKNGSAAFNKKEQKKKDRENMHRKMKNHIKAMQESSKNLITKFKDCTEKNDKSACEGVTPIIEKMVKHNCQNGIGDASCTKSKKKK